MNEYKIALKIVRKMIAMKVMDAFKASEVLATMYCTDLKSTLDDIIKRNE